MVGMTTLVYVHEPIPPFARIAGPLFPESISVEHELSQSLEATMTFARSDVPRQWIEAGMCWVIDQTALGEEVVAGFVDVEEMPYRTDAVTVPLIGAKTALLEIPAAVRLPARLGAVQALRLLLESAQVRSSGIVAGTIEHSSSAVAIDVRGETVSSFIDTVAENIASAHWRERVEVDASGRLQFYFDFGDIRRETDIVLRNHEIIEGIFRRARVISGITEFGSTGGAFDQRAAGSSNIDLTASPSVHHDHLLPKSALVEESLQRSIGPASRRHVFEISERLGGETIHAFCEDRHIDLLRGVEEIFFTLDATILEARRVKLGDIVRLEVIDWYPGVNVSAKVYVTSIEPSAETNERDIRAEVVR